MLAHNVITSAQWEAVAKISHPANNFTLVTPRHAQSTHLVHILHQNLQSSSVTAFSIDWQVPLSCSFLTMPKVKNGENEVGSRLNNGGLLELRPARMRESSGSASCESDNSSNTEIVSGQL